MHDHVDVDVDGGDLVENSRGDARFVRHMAYRDFCLFAVNAYSADDHFFHACSLFFHEGSRLIVKAAANFENDAEFFRKLNRSRLHDLRSEACHLEHLVVGNLGNLSGIFDNARITGVDAVDVGKDLAKIGSNGGSESNSSEVRAATSEGGDLALKTLALKTGNDNDAAGVEKGVNAFWGDVCDFRLGVNPVGDDPGLSTRSVTPHVRPGR